MNAIQRWTLTVVCTSTAVLLINVAAPNVALEAIAKDLDASFTDLQWVLSGYSLVLAVFQLTAGSLADLFGRRRLFVLGLIVFSIASALCALAWSSGLLIAARALQGLGAAMLFPASLALLVQEFEGSARARAIGTWGAVIGLAFAAGPLVGGLLVDSFGWQAIFWLGVALGLPTLGLALTKVRESRDPDPSPIDWGGVVTLSTGLFLIVFAVLRGNALGWTSAPVLGCVAAGLVSLAAFVRVELRHPDPMLDLRLFRNRTFLGATVIVGDAGGRLVRHLRLPVAVPARRRRRQPGRGRPVAGAARALRLRDLARRGAARRAGAADRRAGARDGPDRGRPAADDRRRRGLVVGAPARRPRGGGRRHRARQSAGDLRAPRRAAAGAGRARLRHQQHGAPARARGRDRGARRGAAEQRSPTRWRSAPTGSGSARRAVTDRIADGDVAAATQLAPAGARDSLHSTYDAAFASGINELLLIGVVLSLLGLAAALTLVRTRDFWQPGV